MPSRRSFMTLLGGAVGLPVVSSVIGCNGQQGSGVGSTHLPDTTDSASAVFDGPVGLQLYSVRNEMGEDVADTLRRVYEAGYREVEAFSLHEMGAAGFRQMLDDTGLQCTSFMAGYDRLVDEIEGVADDAETLGASYVSCSWIPHERPFSVEHIDRAIDDFTVAGEQLRQAGLHFCYHAHGYEFRDSGDGGTLFDRFMERTEQGVVDIEMDVFWITWPGQDPVALLQKYPGRFPLFHLKDMRKGTETGDLTGSAPLETNVPVGDGMIDFPEILRVAEQNGGDRYYVEYEHTDALEAVRKSLEYLRAVAI